MTELITVVAIIGIMLAFAIPQIASYMRTNDVRAATQQVAQQLTQARAKAIGMNVNLGVLWLVPTASSSGFVVEDDLQPATAPNWSTISQEEGASWSNLLADPVQTTGFTSLRTNIQLVNPQSCLQGGTLPGSGGATIGSAATDWGLRFSRLGSACAVRTANAATCGAVPPNVTTYTNLIYVDATGTATICLQNRLNNLTRWIRVDPGGRVTSQTS